MYRGRAEPEVEREAARARVRRLLIMARVTNLEDLAAVARQRATELIVEHSFKVVIGKDGDAIVLDGPPRFQAVVPEPTLRSVDKPL